MLATFGYPERAVTLDSGRLQIALGSASIEGLTPAMGAVLATLPGDSARELRVTLLDGAEWRCELNAYQAFRVASDDFDKQVALMRIQASWRSAEGAPWLSSPVVRKWAATQVTETLDLPTREQFRRLQLLRGLAVDLGEADVASTVLAVIRWARLSAIRQPGGEPERAALAQVIEWAGMEVDFALI